MSDDRIDPFREFYYETGIDPTGGEPDTGEEELIEDEGLSDAVWRLPLQSFTSYDVETANEYPSSICSMGFIFVRI